MILNVNTKPLNSSGVPVFTYTGKYEIVDDNNNALSDLNAKNWKIRLLTSGNLTFTNLKGAKKGIDVFLVGGGGKGGKGYSYGSSGGTGGGGGGGGYTTSDFFVPDKTLYKITVGGSAGNTSAFGFTANCGSNGGNGNTSNGGSGGAGTGAGAKGGNRTQSGVNGSKGAAGAYEFGESGSSQYGGGGGGGAGSWMWDADDGYHTAYGTGGAGGAGGGGAGNTSAGKAGTKNTGGGGGGGGWSNSSSGGSGGSGIVVIRNTRSLSWDGLFEATPTVVVNVRSSPQVVSSPSNVVGQLAKGQKVAIYEIQAGTGDSYVWGRFNLPSLSGWIALQNFTYNAYCEINNEAGAILYSSANTSSSSQLLTLPKGERFFSTNISQTNKTIWLQTTVKINGTSYSGYILNDKVKFLSER